MLTAFEVKMIVFLLNLTYPKHTLITSTNSLQPQYLSRFRIFWQKIRGDSEIASNGPSDWSRTSGLLNPILLPNTGCSEHMEI